MMTIMISRTFRTEQISHQ